MKKTIMTLISLLMVLSLFVGCGSNSVAPVGENVSKDVKPIELKMNVTTSESSVWMVGAETFKKLVEEKTGGRYTISIFPNEQLSGGNLQKGVEMLFTGVTDLDIHSLINMTGFEPKLTVCMMPWLFPNGYDSVDEVMSGEGGEVLFDLIRAKGAEPLGIGENGFRQITNNVRPIKNVADMKQLKIRTPPIAMYVDLFKLFGADPTSMSFSEVFTALQQGTIDGQENPYDTIRSGKIHEVQKYMTIWNYSYDPLILSVSGKVWNNLSDEDKAIFKEAGKVAMAEQIKASRKMDGEIIEQFSKVMEVNKLTPEQIAEFQAAAAPIYDSYREIIGDDLFAAFGYSFE